MTPAELRVAISSLGLTQNDFADMLDIRRRTLRNYLSGVTQMDGPGTILVRILVARRNWNDLLTIGYGGRRF